MKVYIVFEKGFDSEGFITPFYHSVYGTGEIAESHIKKVLREGKVISYKALDDIWKWEHIEDFAIVEQELVNQ